MSEGLGPTRATCKRKPCLSGPSGDLKAVVSVGMASEKKLNEALGGVRQKKHWSPGLVLANVNSLVNTEIALFLLGPCQDYVPESDG